MSITEPAIDAGTQPDAGTQSDASKENEPTLKSFEEPLQTSNKPSSSDMEFYYERLLPFRYIFQWLNHSAKPQKDFTMREFAFEFRLGAYQRYNSFTSADDFKKQVIKANPTRFEVGAVYTVNPKERKNLPKSAMKAVSKELVFDIDLTDYDDIRTCCSGTSICKKCWKFVQVATRVVDAALKDDFGFNELIWVFSGRRGAHCWVSDKRARELDESSRRAIVEYLDIFKSKKVLKKPLHPHLERSFNILKEEFVNVILEEQDVFATKFQDLLNMIPIKSLQQELESHWNKKPSSSVQKWEDLNEFAKRTLKSQKDVTIVTDAKKEIIIHYLYPRLDLEVSKQVIHLLKSPFCIHPGTGNVCVPFNPTKDITGKNNSYGFDPTTAPNLRRLQHELQVWETKHAARELSLAEDELEDEPRRMPDWEKTSLKPYVDYFARHVNNIIQTEHKKRERTETLDF